MGRAGQALTRLDIVGINREMISRHGGEFLGTDNLRLPETLDYVIDVIQSSLSDQELYPGLFRKAAVLCHRIIKGHLFYDGNKRTGLTVAVIMLDMNGYTLNPRDGGIEFAEGVATGLIDEDGAVDWLTVHAVAREAGWSAL